MSRRRGGMRARIEGKINKSMAQGEVVMAKFELLADEGLELLKEFEEEGITMSFKLKEYDMPIKVKIKIGDEGIETEIEGGGGLFDIFKGLINK
jgi:hypothetical protein